MAQLPENVTQTSVYLALQDQTRVRIVRTSQSFPPIKRSRHLSTHSAFQLGLWTLKGRIRPVDGKVHQPQWAVICFPPFIRWLPFAQAYPGSPSPCPCHTARRLATTLPPPSRPRAGIFAPHDVGHAAWEFPSSSRRDVLATRSCLLNAERFRDSASGRKDPAGPPPSHFGPGVTATYTCLLLRRFRRFLSSA